MLSPAHLQAEILGPVVSVNDDDFTGDAVQVGPEATSRAASPSFAGPRGPTAHSVPRRIPLTPTLERLQIPTIVPPGAKSAGAPLQLVTEAKSPSPSRAAAAGRAHQIVTESGERVKIVGSADDQQRRRSNGRRGIAPGELPPFKPKFSEIVNEYMGACLEDNCNIGE